MVRDTRYQAAIVRDDHVLLIQVREHADGRTYWSVPGGGMEDGESPEACVAREAFEETGLRVTVNGFVCDDPDPTGWYETLRTYLCEPYGGDARPGCEPELGSEATTAITAVAWYDLRRPETWGAEVREDPITLPILERIRSYLGYVGEARAPG